MELRHDKKDHERLLEMFNDEGKSVAEELREMVQMSYDAWEEGKEIEKEEKSDSEANKPTHTNTRIW